MSEIFGMEESAFSQATWRDVYFDSFASLCCPGRSVVGLWFLAVELTRVMFVDYQWTVHTAAQERPAGHVQCCSRLFSKTLHQVAWNYDWCRPRVCVHLLFIIVLFHCASLAVVWWDCVIGWFLAVEYWPLCLWYWDIEENCGIFSLIQMCYLPSARACAP